AKLPLVDEVLELDKEIRALKSEGEALRASRNDLSKQIGMLMKNKEIDKANELKNTVSKNNVRIAEIDSLLEKLTAQLNEKMLIIPQIVDPSVPVGKDDSENVEIEKFGEPVIPAYEIPYHADIISRFNGLDKDASGRTSGNGFYYLVGDIARMHSAMLSFARDFMINKGFTYCIPPFMIRSDVVNGVMSFAEMENMMYKIEGEDLYLIGTSEHSMIGRFKGQIIKEAELPLTLTSYSPCFRKEVGAHGIEERGIYRVHQFEKQEMIVICKPEDSMEWYHKMWSYTVEFFRSLDVPVRTLECCTGDLADLKVKSCDVEAWSPRQQKYFEVGSCSTLGDAQARRLGIRTKNENGTYLVHTLNNTVLATPRGLIAVIENNYNEDGSIRVPKALQPYMGGTTILKPVK
ncbi:MAG: serine--tRNA ligase, partial [Anaeroplasmataceae bacterium]|nr:serine--tRNA ligase [Anaeroplasmataceae bacterium]